MTHPNIGTHRDINDDIRALRMILTAFDETLDGWAAFQAVLAEFDDCPDCRRAVMARLAIFAADRVQELPAERQRRLIDDRLGKLLDEVAAP